ncbi:MAG: hypothetical protein IKQ69_05140 [Oscillospiraceae bacterium]|nr:hypothetical protein [Oscillospiraceae bacterium]
MEEQKQVLAVCVRGCPDGEEALGLVRAALRERGDFGAVEVEMLPGKRETLLLIHPAAGVYIDRRAAEYLTERLQQLLTDMV